MNLTESIKNGWEISAQGYSKNIVADDFEEPGRSVWTNLILEKAPYDGKLNILDVGTGPGVFAVLLSMAGHQVTGIDISPNMLKEAEENAARMGVHPVFTEMDTQEIVFPDNTFDLIVSRNVVWIMQEPEKAYASWLRCLKPGGRVIVFDGGHAAREKGSFREDYHIKRNEEYFEKFGEDVPLSFQAEQYEEARGWKRELKLTYEARPEWDVETMQQLGYTDVHWDDVNAASSYNEKLKCLNEKEGIFFRLCGTKAK